MYANGQTVRDQQPSTGVEHPDAACEWGQIAVTIHTSRGLFWDLWLFLGGT